MFSSNKAAKQVIFVKATMESISESVSPTSFGYHIKPKHDVFSDGTGQKYHVFHTSFLGWYNLSPKKRFAISLQHSRI